MKKKETQESSALAEIKTPQPVYRMTLSRDELYRIVNATYHAREQLAANSTFAIRHRGNAYGSIARRMDEAYIQLVENGLDARFDVQFFLREEKRDAANNDV